MGNCQAAEATTVVIQHPGGRVERAYWSLRASQVMASNPGHYVAAVIVVAAPPYATSVTARSGDAALKHLKLLRPDDTLHIGRVYRLVSFEEVVREFASTKHEKLGRLLVKQKEKHRPRSERGGDGGASMAIAASGQPGSGHGGDGGIELEPATEEQEAVDAELQDAAVGSTSAKIVRHGQWKPTLQSIAEVASS
ncbi:hypothetical protein OPV22_016315 [Ensete ventricosum]|uniref:DUF4228 domain-containing protein n=1 Tax=Ensete ventricosum TaxID=4639 RepID=A0AAV8QRA6_ENSVE|nr:hypothetical protein OPV22_016315 [Ensete ventricosum]